MESGTHKWNVTFREGRIAVGTQQLVWETGDFVPLFSLEFSLTKFRVWQKNSSVMFLQIHFSVEKVARGPHFKS